MSTTSRVPEWLPPEGLDGRYAAGEAWDAIVVSGSGLASRTWFHLHSAHPNATGPVVFDPYGYLGTWYYLVPVGTAAEWKEGDTYALGSGQMVPIPGNLGASRDLRWMQRPTSGPEHVDPEALRQALAKARDSAS